MSQLPFCTNRGTRPLPMRRSFFPRLAQPVKVSLCMNMPRSSRLMTPRAIPIN